MFIRTDLVLVRQQEVGVRLQFDVVTLKVCSFDGAEGNRNMVRAANLKRRSDLLTWRCGDG